MIDKITFEKYFWINNYPELHLKHIMIFKAIEHLYRKFYKARQVNGRVPIKSFEILEALPLLHIKSPGGLTPYIKKLKSVGAIETYQDTANNRFYMPLISDE